MRASSLPLPEEDFPERSYYLGKKSSAAVTLNPKAEFLKELGTSSSQGSTSLSPAPHSLDPGSMCLTLHWFKKQKQKKNLPTDQKNGQSVPSEI